jgi:hypothetical protein
VFGISLDQAGAKLGEDGMVKAGIAKVQAEGVFPSQSITHGGSLLAIRQAFHKLEHRHQRQAPRSESGLTMGRKQVEPSPHHCRWLEAVSRTCMNTLPRAKTA